MSRSNSASVIPFSNFSSPLANLYEDTARKIERLEFENKQLHKELAIERKFRYDSEREVENLKIELQTAHISPKRVRRTKLEIEDSKISATEFKTDGKRKARPADSIRSYEDFLSVQTYFLEKNKIRDWMLWTIGISLGLRISDLLQLKICNFIDDTLKFRKRIVIVEQKTCKLNNCLITESVVDSITKYLDSIKWVFNSEDYLFMSHKTKGKMFEEYGWKILSDAGKALNLPIVIGSHTMRKSFANIAACADKSNIDMNAITKIQGLLNHSDQRVTMRYLGTFQNMFDKARVAVSDFVLGRTDVHELVAGNSYTIDDIISKLDLLEAKIKT